MSAIAGFYMPYEVFSKDNSFSRDTIHKMSEALIKRGPDHQEYHLFAHGAFCHNALFSGSIHPQIPCKTQPVTKKLCNNIYTLFYDGYITNLIELKKKLEAEGEDTADLSQEELLLLAFQTYGPDFVRQLDGAFALVVYDETQNLIYLFRDQLGLRPLYYMFMDKTLIFASEPKGVFAYPNITPTVTREGLNEIFSMGPARSLGKSAFKNLFELKAGHFLVYGKDQMYEECYHQFRIREHTDSYPDTVDHVNELLGPSTVTSTVTSPPKPSAFPVNFSPDSLLPHPTNNVAANNVAAITLNFIIESIPSTYIYINIINVKLIYCQCFLIKENYEFIFK